MKKIFIPIAVIMVMTAIIMIKCQSSAKKTENAESRLQNAETELEKARSDLSKTKLESNYEYEQFRNESEDRIYTDDKNITELKAGTVNEKRENKASFDQKLTD